MINSPINLPLIVGEGKDKHAETPPYTATSLENDSLFSMTKVEMRLLEILLKDSKQQPQISKPTSFTLPAEEAKTKHNFVFSVCFSATLDNDRMARVTANCDGNGGKFKFDVWLGPQCTLENRKVIRGVPSINVIVSRARGITNVGGKTELVFVYTINVLIDTVPFPAEDMIKTCETTILLPELTITEKVKRPRGRPRGSRTAPKEIKQGNSDSNSDSRSPPTSPKDEKKSLKRAREEEPDLAATDATPTVLTERQTKMEILFPKAKAKKELPPLSFSEVEEVYEKSFRAKQQQQQDLLAQSTRLKEIQI